MKELEYIQKSVEQIRINVLKGVNDEDLDKQLYDVEQSLFKAMDLVKKNVVLADVSNNENDSEVTACDHPFMKLERMSTNAFECECGETLYSITS